MRDALLRIVRRTSNGRETKMISETYMYKIFQWLENLTVRELKNLSSVRLAGRFSISIADAQEILENYVRTI